MGRPGSVGITHKDITENCGGSQELGDDISEPVRQPPFGAMG